jgi:hypothetical protein
LAEHDEHMIVILVMNKTEKKKEARPLHVPISDAASVVVYWITGCSGDPANITSSRMSE